jgi:hypothetical protein
MGANHGALAAIKQESRSAGDPSGFTICQLASGVDYNSAENLHAQRLSEYGCQLSCGTGQ